MWLNVETMFLRIFVITRLSLPHISSYYFFRINFHSFHVTQCWQMKAKNVHCNYLRLQSPAQIFLLSVVFYLCLISSFMPTLVFFKLLGHTYSCNKTQTRKAIKSFLSVENRSKRKDLSSGIWYFDIKQRYWPRKSSSLPKVARFLPRRKFRQNNLATLYRKHRVTCEQNMCTSMM